MARKWHKLVAIKGMKKIGFLNKSNNEAVGVKGHFVIYSNDQKRYVLPLAYLNNYIFQELLKVYEEELGLSSGGPLTLPCHSSFINYIVSVITTRNVSKDLEKKLS